MSEHPSKLLAYVRFNRFTSLNEIVGPILESDGEFFRELQEVGTSELGDIEIERPEQEGLQVFEGWLEHDQSVEPDPPRFVGWWRRLDHWELCLIRVGKEIVGDRKEPSDG